MILVYDNQHGDLMHKYGQFCIDMMYNRGASDEDAICANIAIRFAGDGYNALINEFGMEDYGRPLSSYYSSIACYLLGWLAAKNNNVDDIKLDRKIINGSFASITEEIVNHLSKIFTDIEYNRIKVVED